MKFIELTWSSKTGNANSIKIRVDAIVAVEPRSDGEGTRAAVRTLTSCYPVEESVDEVLAKIAEATKPVTVAWAEQPKAMAAKVEDKLLLEMTKSLKLEERIQVLESQLAAWRKAANTDPTDGESDEVLEFLTPGDLAERITGLYRWATTAEKHRTEATGEVAELKAKLAATEEECRNQQKRADGWCKRATIAEKALAEAKEVTPVLDIWRVLATAAKAFDAYAINTNRNEGDRLRAKTASMAISAFNGCKIGAKPYEFVNI